MKSLDLLDALGWIAVPAGVLQRGTPIEDIDRLVAEHADLGLPRHYLAKEAPRAAVNVPSFTILRTPVTVAVWNEFAEATALAAVPADGRYPIENRTWDEVQAFCAWLSTAAGEPFELPSEAEWERAARGDDVREFPWGDAYDKRCANLAEAGLGGATAVGSFPLGASAFGLLDMAGNGDEWTSTTYAPYPGAPDDVVAVESWALDHHIVRGGSWLHYRDLARCARRHGLYPNTDGIVGAGFRLLRRGP